MTNEYDPWEVAENAKELPRTYFGQVAFDIYPVVFQKGIRGGIPYDAQVHKEEDRRTLIKVSITPLASANVDFITERDYADFAREWASITLPSVKALGVGLRELHEKWVRYEMVPHGTYIKQDTGEEKTLTAPKFLAVYGTEEEAEAAASALYGGGNGDSEPKAAPTGDPKRDVALKFLAPLAEQARGDPAKMAKLLDNDVTRKYFDITSPEVVALLTPDEKEIPFA